MSTTVKVPKLIISDDDFIDQYLKGNKSSQTAFKALPKSGEYTNPREKEKLVLLSYCMNGDYANLIKKALVDEVEPARSTTIKSAFDQYVIETEEVLPASPASITPAMEEEVAVVAIKKESRGQKRLQTEIRSEFFRMIGTRESASINIFRAAIKHFDDNLKDVANMVATVAEIDVAEKDQLIEFSVKSVFGKIFGAIPNTEKITKPILASSPLLVHRYEAVLFKDGGTSSDSAIKAEFKSKVINAAAAKIAEALEEPIADVIEELNPIFEESLENIKKEFSTES